MTQPLSDPGVVDALGADLRCAGYTNDGVAALLGADEPRDSVEPP